MADLLVSEFKLSRDKAEALARQYGTDIAEWLRESRHEQETGAE